MSNTWATRWPRSRARKAGIMKRGVPCVVAAQDDDALDVIEARAARLGVPLMVQGPALACHDRSRAAGLSGRNRPAGPALAQACRAAPGAERGHRDCRLARAGHGAGAEAAVTRADWPARMQRLRHGPLVDALPGGTLWLDGGHNPAAGQAIAATLGGAGRPPALGGLRDAEHQGRDRASWPRWPRMRASYMPCPSRARPRR